MRKTALPTFLLGAILGASLSIAPAQAQATRTWVSGVGDDVNPCSRTAPCKTFAGAISKTAAGGEISVLDPGGFGGVTITKAITLDGDGTLAGILNAGTNGVVINAGSSDKIILRNLSINGAGTGLNGIRYLAGGSVTVDKCTIYGQTVTNIDVALTATGTLNVMDTAIIGGANGIAITTTSGFAASSLQNVKIKATTTAALAAGANSFVSLNESSLSNSAGSGVTTNGGATVNINNSEITNFPIAISIGANGHVRVSGSHLANNTTNVANSGTLSSTGNNAIADGGAFTPNGTEVALH